MLTINRTNKYKLSTIQSYTRFVNNKPYMESKFENYSSQHSQRYDEIVFAEKSNEGSI